MIKRKIIDIKIDDKEYSFASSIEDAMEKALIEKENIIYEINENENSLKYITPNCDKIDYSLAICSGIITGLFDVFLVGKPGETKFGEITDKWYEEVTMKFASYCGWTPNSDNSKISAIRFLENKFKIPYDQTRPGESAKCIFNLTPENHHFKSLGHNPTIVGLFFSILDQMSPTESHFITGDDLISLYHANNSFELKGKTFLEKIFSGFVNWFGHLISDISGSSGSNGRGMGIPSPLFCWMNDIIAIKRTLHIEASEFDKIFNEVAIDIYKKGYDIRFQTAQLFPVLINELIVRFIYSLRRIIKFLKEFNFRKIEYKELWKNCEPFSNGTVKRMLTVAHGSFCLIDISDSTVRGFVTGGGNFNISEFIMRLNIAGVGRFSLCLYSEMTINKNNIKKEIYYLKKKSILVDDYINSLKILSKRYDDKELLNFVDNFKDSDNYKDLFEKSVQLAKKRDVSNDKIVKNKVDIDTYFKRDDSLC